MMQHGVTHHADAGTDHQDEGRAGHGDMRREAEHEDHHRDVNHAAADAENRGEKADKDRKHNADHHALARDRSRIKLLDADVGLLRARLRVHDHAKYRKRAAEEHREARAREIIADVAAEEGAGHRRQCKRQRGLEEDASLTEIGPGAGKRIEHHAEEARAHHLLDRLKGGAVRRHHREHEKRHHDKAAADADERAESADADADAEKFQEFEQHDAIFISSRFVREGWARLIPTSSRPAMISPCRTAMQKAPLSLNEPAGTNPVFPSPASKAFPTSPSAASRRRIWQMLRFIRQCRKTLSS